MNFLHFPPPTLSASFSFNVCKCVNINVTRFAVVTQLQQQLSTCHVAFACQRQGPEHQRPQKSCDPRHPKELSHLRHQTGNQWQKEELKNQRNQTAKSLSLSGSTKYSKLYTHFSLAEVQNMNLKPLQTD